MAEQTIREMLYKTFGSMPAKEKKAKKVEQVVPGSKPPEPVKVEEPKSVGDVTIALQAQSIYDPNLPGAPPKPPNAQQSERGTVGSMDLSSKWDKGNA